MKIKILLLVISIIAGGLHLSAQSKNKLITDPETNRSVMIGYVDKTGLQKEEFGQYFNSQYEIYAVSEKMVKKLSGKMADVAVTIVLGTWCSDSKIQVPRFFKLLDAIKYPAANLTMIAVDSRKEALVVDVKQFNIELVPTFIFYRNGNEIGRIVESPKKSFEKDLWKIVR